ncbi:MAG: arylsulfatase [Bryobacteraceae bacterium]
MLRREFLQTAAVLAPGRKRPPNVLLMMTDDQGYGDLSHTGNPHLKTPHSDSIARDGAEFSQFQVCPVCSPTRSSLMTGRWNYRTRVVDTFMGRSMMDPSEVTMAQYLGRAGYRTGIFGKWHLGDNHPMRPHERGFEEAVVCKGGGVGQPSDPPGNKYFDPILQNRGREQRYEGYCTDIFFREAMGFIERRRRDPWFVYLPTNAPHDPLDVDDRWARPFLDLGLDERTAKTYGMVANIDENVGKILGTIGKLGLTEDTIVIFLTDNGPQRDRYNAGMRGRKGTVYQGGIRVPFFLRWPGKVKAGMKIDRAAAHIDVLPTLLEIAGVDAGRGPRMDGRSLMPLLRGEAGSWKDRTLFTQWHRGDEPELFRACAARSQQYKLVDGKELYDLTADPGEKKDIARERPEVAADLRRQTEAWFRDVTPAGGYAPPRIYVGTRHENPVVLTRQDWRASTADWRGEANGHWEIDVRTAGRYEVKLRMQERKAATEASVRIGEVEAKTSVAAGAESCTFEKVALPAGPARLKALFSAAGMGGPQYVDVRKT